MAPEKASGDEVTAALREKAAEAGIAIPAERMADIAYGASRLRAAAERVRRFLDSSPSAKP